MTKILSTASLNTDLVSSFAKSVLGAVRAVASLFALVPNSYSQDLSARLRYDVGTLDINPDCVRGATGRAGTSPEREMMRRGF